MQVCKWGNSLAIRIPVEVVESLGLKEGDEVEVAVGKDKQFSIRPDRRREQAVRNLEKLGWSLPPSFKFSREEATER